MHPVSQCTLTYTSKFIFMYCMNCITIKYSHISMKHKL